jgi:hypothetical protein
VCWVTVGVSDVVQGQCNIVPMIPDVYATVSAALCRLGSRLRPFDASRSGLTPRLLNLDATISDDKRDKSDYILYIYNTYTYNIHT